MNVFYSTWRQKLASWVKCNNISLFVICKFLFLVYIHVPSAISTRNIDEMQRFYFDRGRIHIRGSGEIIIIIFSCCVFH